MVLFHRLGKGQFWIVRLAGRVRRLLKDGVVKKGLDLFVHSFMITLQRQNVIGAGLNDLCSDLFLATHCVYRYYRTI